MRIKVMIVGLLVLLAHGVWAEEKEATADSAAATPVVADSTVVAASDLWLNTAWKRIEQLTAKERAFEVERATAVAGVRGEEAEDEVVNRLYYKGGARYPTRREVERAIRLLSRRIASDPKAESVPELRYFMAQCLGQLGEEEKASTEYRGLVKEHRKSEWAKKAQKEIDRLEKKAKGK